VIVVAFTTATLVVGVVSIATASPGLLGIGDRHRRAADRPRHRPGCSARDRQGAGAEKTRLQRPE